MLDKVEMSLDDIIKQSKEFKRGGRGGRGRGGMRRGSLSNRGGGGPIRNRRGRIATSRSPYSRTQGDINSRWQHDMYDGPAFNKRRGTGSLIGGSGSAKLVVSNLDYGVSNSDIMELFVEFGPLKSAVVNYDKSGRSLGSANVLFERKADAIKAMRTYNGVPLDGRPMNIEVATSDVSLFQPRSRGFSRGGGGGMRGRGGLRRGGRGAGRGGRGRGGKGVTPTAEELNADLDAYINKIK